MKEFELSSRGAGKLHCYRWEPADQPIGIVQLVHGIAEHALRYDAFAQFLTKHGYLVVAEDHMGHGKSLGNGTPLYFEGGWDAAVADTYQLLEKTQSEFPTLPYFLLGHSMGSFMTRTILYRYPKAKLSGAIICGTAWQPALILTGGRLLCAMERLRLGEKRCSKLLVSLMFGTYNRKFKNAKTPNDWINSDPDEVALYVADPLCGGDPTVGLAQTMLGGIAGIQKKHNLQAMQKELPILFIAGKSDPVGAMGKGVEKTAKKFRNVGMQNVQLHLYDGRHEILREPNRDTIFSDVLAFLEKNR